MTKKAIDLTAARFCVHETQPGVIWILLGDEVERCEYSVGDGEYITNDDVAALYFGEAFNQHAREYANLFAASPLLLAACKKFMALLESGVLVRNINGDGSPDWALKALELVQNLNQIQTAIAKAEAA